MIGLGTIINTGAIAVGGTIGCIFGNRLSERFQKTLMTAQAVCVMFLGIGGCMEKMLEVGDGKLSAGGTMMMLASFSIGSLLGELLNLKKKMEDFGTWLKKKTRSESDGGFVDAFVTSSLTVCVGAMAIVGSIQDGIFGDYSTLSAKAILDFIIILIMASSMGKGAAFSAVPVFLFQGTVTVLAHLIEPLMTEQALANISFTGSMLIFCVGANLIWEKKFPVANMLPTIVVAAAWSFFG